MFAIEVVPEFDAARSLAAVDTSELADMIIFFASFKAASVTTNSFLAFFAEKLVNVSVVLFHSTLLIQL
jgi:hypothetical protein